MDRAASGRNSKPAFLAILCTVFIAVALFHPWSTALPVAVVYDDSLQGGWSDQSWDAAVDYGSTTYVHAGTLAMSFQSTEAWGSWSAVPAGGSFRTDPYSSVRFYVSGGTDGGQKLGLMVQTRAGWSPVVSLDDFGGVAANQWRLVDVPLSALGAQNVSLTRLALQDVSGGTQPPVYVDDVQFVGGSPPLPTGTPTVAPPSATPTPTVAPPSATPTPTGTSTPARTPTAGMAATPSVRVPTKTPSMTPTETAVSTPTDMPAMTPTARANLIPTDMPSTAPTATSVLSTATSTATIVPPTPTRENMIGRTTVAAFKDGKRGAISLLFDDSLPSQADNAIPALAARNLVGSFFVNPGTDTPFAQRESVWKQAPALGMELANHTMNHIGAKDYAQAEYEIGEAARRIRAMQPKASPLLSFSSGGLVTWNITDAEMAELQARYYSPQRPPWVSMTGGDLGLMRWAAQGALDRGDWTRLLFHGVGGDYSSVPLSDFTAFLDYLVSVRDQVWIAQHIDAYKYTHERDTATVQVAEATASLVRLTLSSAEDPAIYDFPLTLRTNVPSEWATVNVVQNGATRTYPARGGVVQYEALPDRGEVALTQGNSPPPIDTTTPAGG